jgi:DtxR family Mn-dependent transcriptional regulator
MDLNLTISIQDYLKNIYELTENGESASTNALASKLNIKPASVTGMVKKLASSKPALVVYQKHQGVRLTKAGEKAALEVIRHHRLIEAWLVRTLDYSWEEVHIEAERMEHAISEDFERRIAAAMGNPERDPHGEPIPNADLIMPVDNSIPLSSLQPGQEARVSRVHSQDPRLLRYLEEIGLIPGARLKALEVSPFDQVMHFQIQDREEVFVLGPAITHQVFIEIQ